jgi:hypothetical protein
LLYVFSSVIPMLRPPSIQMGMGKADIQCSTSIYYRPLIPSKWSTTC